MRLPPVLRDLTVPFCPLLDPVSEQGFQKTFGIYRFNSGNGHGAFGQQEIPHSIAGVSGADTPFYPTLAEDPSASGPIRPDHCEKGTDLAL